MTKIPSKIASLVLFGLASQAVSAYNYVTCSDGTPLFHNDGNPTFRYGNNLFDSEIADFNTAFSRLTAFSAATITGVDVDDDNVLSGNGENEIWWTSTVETADCAYWFVDSPSCDVTEVDIRLGDQNWYSSGEDSNHAPYGSSGRSVLGVAIHEGGHCIGLAHENDEYNVMGDERTHVTRNGLTTYYGPGESASDGLIDLHGKRSGDNTYRDVGISIMRYSGASGEYSQHDFGSLRSSGGTPLPVIGSYVGQDISRVEAGQSIQVEFTLENNGEKNAASPIIGIYLSDNHLISNSDLLLKEMPLGINRDSALEYTTTVTIPADTAPGNHYLGLYADNNNAIPEVTSANNVGYYPITVVAPDLVVTDASVSDATLSPSQSFTASAIARNTGTGDSVTSTLRYLYSVDNVISMEDGELGTDTVAPLTAGGTSFESQTIAGPSEFGTFWMGACVDAVGNEADTTNQCTTAPIQVTVTSKPVITPRAASGITETQATLNSKINPGGAQTTVYIDWGADATYGNTINYGLIGSGGANVSITSVLPNLVCGETYFYRFRAVNDRGTKIGPDQQLTTIVCGGC